jgi:hypothetical protein
MDKVIQIYSVPFSLNDWTSVLSTSLSTRQGYENREQLMIIPHMTGRLLGTTLSEDEYYETLFDAIHQNDLKIHFLSEELDKTIQNDRFQSIQKIFMIHQEEKGLSVNRFVAFMDGEHLIPQFNGDPIHRHIRTHFMNLLKLFEKKHKNGLLDPDFRRFIVDMTKWMWNHLDPWLKSTSFLEEVPRVLWYGEANKSESYFLYFLMILGCDVLLFHPEGKDILADLDPKEEVAKIVKFPSQSTMIHFPTTRPVRKATVAFRASQEMDKVLHSDDSMLYKSWQFRKYKPISITLKTTYDELFLMAREKAFIRPNFLVKDHSVQIPSLFSKILGLSKNRKQYWDRMHELSEGEFALTIKQFPFTQELKGNLQFHYKNALDSKGKLVPEKILKSNWWKYDQLPEGLQLGLAAAVSRYCAAPRLERLEHETEEQLKIYLFAQAMDIPLEVLHLLQKFDYSQDVPKLILYHNELNGTLSRSDAALLLLLNEIGIDIIVYNPPGLRDVEMFIEDTFFDKHWLEDVTFGEAYRESSAIRKWMKKMF